MKLNVSLTIVTTGCVALIMIAASSLQGSTEQVLHGRIAKAAIATVNLLQERSNHRRSATPASLAAANSSPETAVVVAVAEGSSPAGSIYPDEPLNVILDQRFSLNHSLTRIGQISEALNSFHQLTLKHQRLAPSPVVANTGNAEPEVQTLGFQNWVGTVEGTLVQQHYQIAKLEYELAQKQYQDREISQVQLAKKAMTYQQANQEYQDFLNSFRIAD